jgi:glycosyltransferase involved in cell wall biosynthesis
MSNLEVLCVTMHQKDFSKLKEMNIQSDVVFANQADRYAYEELEFNGHTARMITTDQRGVGKNRNTALLYARGNVCLFSDDDVCYADGYAEKVVAAFDEVPNADVIVFNLTSKSERTQKQNNRIKKCKKWNVLGFGTCRIAIKLDAVQRANIWFTSLFGGGCKYPSGEDSIWLLEALRKGLKIYTHPLVIGELKQEGSTWFHGYDEEYFFGRGALLQAAFPNFKYLIGLIYFPWRFRNITNLNPKDIRAFITAGIKAFTKGIDYEQWKGGKNC